MKHLSLFSGIGGIDLAAEWAGFESSIMVERDKFCQRLLKQNFPDAELFDDVTTFNGLDYRGDITLLSAGFPCQPHSLAGKRKASGDERDLWSEVVRILGEVQPRWFLGENVPGLLSSESGRFFGRVVNDLAKVGYRMGWGMYGAKDVGAVHRRNRVFIVAHAEGEPSNVPNARQFLSYRQKQEQFGGGNSKSSSTNAEGEPSNGGGFAEQLCSESQTEELRGQDNQERQEGRQEQSKGGRFYQAIKTGDWRQWGISPTVRLESRVRGSNDGVPNRVDRLKALGNAVVPQQVYPILAEIARLEHE
jgi:DNA (cytosine-5)-methyltransferase 1